MTWTTLCRGAASFALTAGAAAGIAQAQTPTSSPSSPVLNEDRSLKITGRIQYDVYDIQANFASAGQNQSYVQSDTRRFFLGVEGRWTDQWRYNVKASFKENPSTVGLDDAFLEYNGGDWSGYIGQYNPTSPMEDRDSSLNLPFNERSSMINAFGFAKRMGVFGVYRGGNWSLAAGVNGRDLGASSDNLGNEEVSVSARGAWAPILERTPDGTKLLHLGLSLRHRDNGGADKPTGLNTGFTYSTRPDVGFGTSFVSTGAIGDHDMFEGGEVAGQWNQFGFDGEYGALRLHPTAAVGLNRADRKYTGGYAGVYWSPTGESRNYLAGEGAFGRVTPIRALGPNGGLGHVMLAGRYEYLDLSDDPLGATHRGGKQTSYVAQMTWEPIAYVKFQVDYAENLITNYLAPAAAAQRGDANTVVARLQLDW